MGTTALHCACKLNYFEITRHLLEHGADPNAVCKIDDTPLHCAVTSGNAEIADILLENGANPYYKTTLGESIFDNWPPWATVELTSVLKKHKIKQ